MLIGVIADDFTGASDIANTLARGVAPEGGLRTAQFAGVPDAPAPATMPGFAAHAKVRAGLSVRLLDPLRLQARTEAPSPSSEVPWTLFANSTS